MKIFLRLKTLRNIQYGKSKLLGEIVERAEKYPAFHLSPLATTILLSLVHLRLLLRWLDLAQRLVGF